ncbi:MerR family transcriptional regulator [Sabulicella glaciei]|uniref:Uncharacterized protein n=1 Tax=Sabulicella glaciei TaxID=2984948 RepID=A0ABT3P260_9PROT|nr:hypothetical protein [Roseococcus sp. MDT2-1-1]MCW8088495.1 hypothetical protein [Roseococcus sp. MDT2-1-1]
MKKLLALWEIDDRTPEEVRKSAMRHVWALEAKAHAMRSIGQALRDLADTIEAQDRPKVPRFEVA